MFPTPLMIATIVAAALGAAAGFEINRLITRPIINRVRAELADAAWKLTHDPLTGLHNRSGLRMILAATSAACEPQPIILILIDLDLFKEVNDTHGHDIGDELLIEIADRIGHLTTVYGGKAARLSGDEFVAVMPLGRHQVASLAELFNTLIAEPVKVYADSDAVTVAVTASLGITLLSSTDLFEGVALHHADVAMYHAKQQGGNRHVFHQADMTMPGLLPRRGPRLRDRRDTQNGDGG